MVCDAMAIIWKDPNTKRYGRNGQNQDGVDVYGKSGGQNVASQVKNMDRLTEAKALEEINRAKSYNPPIKELHFAICGDRDTRFTQFIEKQSCSHVKHGGFSVHVWFFEDIVQKLTGDPCLEHKYLKAFMLSPHGDMMENLERRIAELLAQLHQRDASPVTKKVSEVIAPALSEHDGCWRLLISVSEAKQVEGGNHSAEQRFIVDPKLVNPEASSQRPLQEFWEDPLPSGQPVSFQELRDILISLISVARRAIIKHIPGGLKPELLTILSLENKLIREARWIHLLKKLKQFKNARPPIAIACLCRQSDGNPSGDFRWVEPGTRSIEHSLDIINLTNAEGSRFKDLRWLLIEDQDPRDHKASADLLSNEGVAFAISRKCSNDLDLLTSPQVEDCFFEDHHALFLRWKGSSSRFAKRLEKILEAGIPLFLLEPLSADPTSIASSTHIFNWECHDFVPNYCRKHRRPESAEDRSLVHSYLFWEDHRYRPFKEVPPMQTESLIPFIQ
jgi:hypothetical protein